MRLKPLVIFLLSLGALPAAANAAECGALLAQHMGMDLELQFDAFDQDEHQGWRQLANSGCESEAADLIFAYSAKHPNPVLAWHRAQMLAEAGKTVDAIDAARQTLRPPHSDDSTGFDWNDYANATIAFLQGDREALQVSRDRLAEAAEKMAFNQPNLHSVDRLLRCFGRSYKVAYSCPLAP